MNRIMTPALAALVLPDLVIERTLVDAEVLGRRLHESDSALRTDALFVDAKGG